MRYAALVGDSSDALTRYGDSPNAALKPEHMGLSNGVRRTPDAMLYALAKFIYSLRPPANPNPVSDLRVAALASSIAPAVPAATHRRSTQTIA